MVFFPVSSVLMSYRFLQMQKVDESYVTVRDVEVLWDHPANTEKIIVEKLDDLPSRPGYEFVKRAFDLFAGIVLLVLLLLPMMIIGLAIRISSRGGAIYRQIRLGKNEVPFTMYKFRTMYSNAEEKGLQWAEENDERTTKIGKWLRTSRVDELPQLLNIILGHMSFVGPRPERPEFYEVFDSYIDGFRQRMAVKPGFTGLAQVSGGYDLYPEEKIVFDLEYIKRRSVGMDLKCLLRTAQVVFGGHGAR